MGKVQEDNNVILLMKQHRVISALKKRTKAFVVQFRRFINIFDWAKRM